MQALRGIFLLSLSFGVLGHTFPRTRDEFKSGHDNGSMDVLFNRYKKIFDKSFSSTEEEKQRFGVFAEKVNSFFDWNEESSGHSYRKGITKFTDMDAESRRQFVMPETRVNKVITACCNFFILNLYVSKWEHYYVPHTTNALRF